MPKPRVIFITGTDTGIGKTISTLCLGILLRAKGLNVGVMKPAQCAGGDAAFLKRALALKDDLRLINPFYAPEPLSPHLAFRRRRIRFDKRIVKKCLKELCQHHEIVLVEGAGGLMVPLTDTYYNADLIVDLKAEVVIVARLGLGTINHTLLTINEIKRCGLKITGLIFSESEPRPRDVPERTNPQEIKRLSGVKILGTIPYLKSFAQKNILRQCQNLKLDI